MIGLLLKETVAKNGHVTIRDLGTFTGISLPAVLHFADRTIAPASLEIRFQREVYLEGPDFTELLAARFAFKPEQANAMVESWVKHANHSLDFSHRFEIAGFGLLKPDLEHVVQFEPRINENYQAESFGLPTLKAEMLASLLKKQIQRETPVIPLHPYDYGNRTERNTTWKPGIRWASVAAVFVALMVSVATIFYLSKEAVQNSQALSKEEQAKQSQKANLVPAIPVPASRKADPKQIVLSAKSTKDLRLTSASKPIATTQSGTSFYVVAGSFRMDDKSRECQQKLNQSGYSTSLLFCKEKSVTRVSIGRFATKPEALQFLGTTQPKFEDQLWVLTE